MAQRGFESRQLEFLNAALAFIWLRNTPGRHSSPPHSILYIVFSCFL